MYLPTYLLTYLLYTFFKMPQLNVSRNRISRLP